MVDGYLNAGDRIILRLGDRRFGGPGTRIQTFVETGFRFRCYIDPLGTSRYAAIPGDVCLDIVPGPVSRLAVTTPRLVRPGAACPVFVRAEDAWGNTCTGLARDIRLTAAIAGHSPIDRIRTLPALGWATLRFDDLPTAETGEMALRATLVGQGPALAAEAFVTIDEACPVARPFYADLHDSELTDREFVSGPFSIADIALFPHLASAKAMEVEFSAQSHPNLTRWFKQMRTLPICAADSQRARDYVVHMKDRDLEKKRIFWRGDRIEWVLARSFHPWFFKEINEGRVLWPGLALPASLNRNVA